MKRNIVRRIAQTKPGYLLWSLSQGTVFGRVLSRVSATLQLAEERVIAAFPQNRRHDAAQRAILDAFEQETKSRRHS